MDGFNSLQATVAAFGMFLPGILELRHNDPRDARKQKDIRLGMLLAGIWSFVVSAHYANKSNSHVPYIYWLAGMSTMLVLYETAFRDGSDIDLRDND